MSDALIDALTKITLCIGAFVAILALLTPKSKKDTDHG